MAVSPERPGARLTGRGRCFIIHDKNGQKLAQSTSSMSRESGQRSPANLLTKDEARRLASNLAKLPDLPRR